MIHLKLSDLGSNTTSLSFVAFERSIEPDLDSPGSGGKLSVRTQMPNEHTKVTSNVEGFEGRRTLLHQRRYCQEVFLAKPRQSKLPEVNTARKGQQSTGERFHSSLQIKLKGPAEHGWAQGLVGGQRPIGIITTINRRVVGDDHIQVLEKRK